MTQLSGIGISVDKTEKYYTQKFLFLNAGSVKLISCLVYNER